MYTGICILAAISATQVMLQLRFCQLLLIDILFGIYSSIGRRKGQTIILKAVKPQLADAIWSEVPPIQNFKYILDTKFLGNVVYV